VLHYGVIKVGWPSSGNTCLLAQVWRVLDLSGMTSSVRESRNFTRAGFVFLNGSKMQTLKKGVPLGEIFTLELRFPNGVTQLEEIMLIPFTRHSQLEQRSNDPTQLNYRGNSKVTL